MAYGCMYYSSLSVMSEYLVFVLLPR